MKKPFELTLYYQAKRYCWHELCQQMSSFPETEREAADVIVVSAQQRLSITLALLQGFLESRTIFPVISERVAAQRLKPPQSPFEKGGSKSKVISEWSLVSADIALAVATSGTGAAAKVALISRHNIISHCQNFNNMIPVDNHSIWLNCMPMNHIAGIMIVYRCWFNNAAMLLHDDFDAKQVWHDLHHYPVTHISLVPRMLFRLLEQSHDAVPPKHLRYVIVGGDRLADSLYQRAISLGWPIFISYGMTEATSTIAIGRSPENLVLLDGFDAQVNAQQELKIKGAMVISCYANTNNSDFEQHWFKTRDLVELNGSCLNVIARNDHSIIVGGETMAPETIEQQLMNAPGVDDIAVGKVIERNTEGHGDTICALVCGDISQLQSWLDDNMHSYNQPRFFLEVSSIPRNSMGKIDRTAVQILLAKQINH